MFSTCVYLCCLFCIVLCSLFLLLFIVSVIVIVLVTLHFSGHFDHCSCYYSFATLTEGFPCFFLICKANARVKFERRGMARTYQFSFLCIIFLSLYYAYCMCVNV
jgi:hypothetical protein